MVKKEGAKSLRPWPLIVPENNKPTSTSTTPQTNTQSKPRPRIKWVELLARVFAIDMKACPNCGGNFKPVAAILETKVIVRILDHLGLPSKPPPVAPAQFSASIRKNAFQAWTRFFACRVSKKYRNAEVRPILLGYSLGGRLAMHALIRFPHLFAGAILVSSNPGLGAQATEERTARVASDEEWAKRFAREPWGPHELGQSKQYESPRASTYDLSWLHDLSGEEPIGYGDQDGV